MVQPIIIIVLKQREKKYPDKQNNVTSVVVAHRFN